MRSGSRRGWRRRWAVLSALVVVVVAGCGGEDDDAPGGFEVARIAERVERLRGLEFDSVPKVRVLPKEDFADEAAEVVETSAGADAQARQDIAQAKRRLSVARQFLFLTELLSPQEIDRAARGESGVAGLYGFKTNELLVLDEGSRRRRELTIAHELTHALEDQAFGARLAVQMEPLSDSGAAYQALLEGSATLVELRYAERFLGTRGTLDERLLAIDRRAAASELPAVLAASVAFPYAEGGRFVLSLQRRAKGWRLVDRAYRHPPKSTAGVIHPERFLRGERVARPTMNGEAVLGEDWSKLGTLELGELDTAALLEANLHRRAAQAIAAGWAGGSVEAFRRPAPDNEPCEPPCRERIVLDIGWTWRSERAATAANKAIADWLTRALDAEPSAPNLWKVDGSAGALRTTGKETHLVFAPTDRLAQTLIRLGMRF